MIKGDKRNDSDIRNEIWAKTVITVIAGIATYILMKRNWRTKNIGATTDIIKGGVVITIDILQPITGDSMDHGHRDIIGSIRTNVGMTKVQKTHREPRHPPRNNRRFQQNRDEQAIATETATPPERETGESSVHCFVCQQPGHYATQCPLRKGKGPTVNTITVEVQQVTTRQQTKNADWTVQEEIRKAAQAWVEKANMENTECMR